MQQVKPEPLWDEGISSFLLGEYQKLSRPLTTDDLRNFANEHAVRIGDILETLYLMVIYGVWRFSGTDGEEQPLDENALNALYAKGRISESDLQAFAGYWEPL